MKYHASHKADLASRRLFSRLSLSSCFWAVAFLCLVLLGTRASATPYPLPTIAVASDGAVSTNIGWEAGTSAKWYIELQRYGAAYVDAGIHREDPALIQQGLHILDWGFAHQSADGSFSTTSDQFHSTTFFVEAAARATLELKAYHPSTYSLDSSVYAATITSYTQNLHAAALWLLTPAAEAWGLPKNVPFTHRRWMLAAALAETSALTGDASLGTAALPFAKEGLSLQLGTGWTAALSAAVAGVTPPATLVAPGTSAPAGTVKSISAEGVNPERGGYDVSYQCVGLLMAERYYPLCPDAGVQAQVKDMIGKGLKWEKRWVSSKGIVSYEGSTRMGIETDRAGNVKIPDLGTIREAFAEGQTLSGDLINGLLATRILQCGQTVCRTPISTSGAVNGNAAFDAGTSASWGIGQQAVGATFVDAGIGQENETLIKQGLSCFNWGFLHEKRDGSFPGSGSQTWGGLQFVEAAARVTLRLKAYHPQSYTLNTAYYDPTIARFTRKVQAAALYLTQDPMAGYVDASVSGSSSRLWTAAAALGEAAQLTGDSSLADAAAAYTLQALALHAADGVFPDDGTPDVNTQAQGLLQAARYSTTLPAGVAQTVVNAAIKAGLDWEADHIKADGTVSGTSAPLTGTIDAAFTLGASLLGNGEFQVDSNRLES